MSYVKNTWANGDTITAEKLNAMENGIYDADASAAEKTYDIAFTADITTDPAHPTAETTASFSDALAAQNGGKVLRAVIDFGDGTEKYGTLLQYDPTEGSESIVFFAVALIGSSVYYIQIAWDATRAVPLLVGLSVAT